MIYKRSKWYWMDDTVNGIRYRLPLETKNWQEALKNEKEKLIEIANGKVGRSSFNGRQTFNQIADDYIERRRLFSAPKTYVTDRERSRVLRKSFGDIPLRKITAEMIADYQVQRINDKISGRTINLKIGLLRRIMKRAKQWSRIADDVEMLSEKPMEARVLSPEEKENLIKTGTLKPGWQVSRCAAVLALNTTMRGCELRGLRLKDIDLFEKIVTIKRQSTKTDAGARVIPLNRDALLALSELLDRAKKLGTTDPEHYLFPACENNHIDPNLPMKSWRRAWRSMTSAAGLKGFRFHDLRHHAITELAEMGLSDQTIMSIAGHVSREMLDHYSHIRITAKRKALEGLETPIPASQSIQGEIKSATVN